MLRMINVVPEILCLELTFVVDPAEAGDLKVAWPRYTGRSIMLTSSMYTLACRRTRCSRINRINGRNESAGTRSSYP